MTGWPEFTGELDRWGDHGRSVAFWRRDDDATTASARLGELLALGGEFDVPVAVAVIPAHADEALADMLAEAGDNCVLQHGYAHRNHAADERKKFELGGDWPHSRIEAELLRGREHLTALFGEHFLPVMVPPWNRIDDGVKSLLPGLGYRGLSTFAPRKRPGADEIMVVNTHIDIIAWLQTRALCGESAALEAAVGHLAAKRTGTADAGEPTGLLTHHLVHDEQCRTFLRRFLTEIITHPAAGWVSARQAFGMAA